MNFVLKKVHYHKGGKTGKDFYLVTFLVNHSLGSHKETAIVFDAERIAVFSRGGEFEPDFMFIHRLSHGDLYQQWLMEQIEKHPLGTEPRFIPRH